MRRPLLLLLFAAGHPDGPAGAQTRASLGVGVGTVRYPGGATFSSTTVSPALQLAWPTVVAGVSGSLASLPDGAWSGQGRGDLWLMSRPIVAGWRLGVEGVVAGTGQSHGPSTAAAHCLGELLSIQPQWGFGVGAGSSAGWIADQRAVTALRTRVRGWWRSAVGAWRADWTMSVEPTRFLGAWFTDVTAGATLERGPVTASLWTAARFSTAYGSTGAGSAFVQFFVMPNVALEASGGSYLRDPYQGLPLARFATLGVRLHGTPRPRMAAARGARWSPLVPQSRGDSLVVRFRFDHARSVAIAGDWNQWRPVGLRPMGGDLWEGTLALRRGVYHFNLVVDGNDWVVPNGVATVSDGLGGMVGVLIVP